MTTIYVDATQLRRPFELHRDARDPQGPAKRDIERYADTLSARGRLIRVYCDDRYTKPWRQRQRDPEYESRDGRATPDYRTIGV